MERDARWQRSHAFTFSFIRTRRVIRTRASLEPSYSTTVDQKPNPYAPGCETAGEGGTSNESPVCERFVPSEVSPASHWRIVPASVSRSACHVDAYAA